MAKRMLASDLDNTLIYSYKQDIGRDKVLVETMGDKELSFMTRKSWELLRDLREEILFVPVSTRSADQYRRIRFFPDWTPDFALVSNGGTLLTGGKEDPEWRAETKERIRDAADELLDARRRMEEDPDRSFEVRLVDNLFLFTKSGRPEHSISRLKEEKYSRLNVYRNGSKIYALPRSLEKGEAVRRLRERTGCPEVWSAGDSEFDLPLLEAADLAFFPQALRPLVDRDPERCVTAGEGELLSDILLMTVRALLHGEKEGKPIRR